MTVSIFSQSSTLGFLPSLELSPASMDSSSPDIILASDDRLPPPRPGRGSGGFKPGSFPVLIPSAHRLTEYFVRLVAIPTRDTYKLFGLSMLTYVEEYVDGDGLLDMESLEPRSRAFYLGLKNETKHVRDLVADLQMAFAEL
ncbi:hypothetical protein LZ554_005377 [Drepanopeziza brunnea f. sp. 'monogermtubi']|nr:hypothetical protein LZ554_005377 [Drepanopeziza brunnea f. sp. 'monogermtubi']